VIGDLIGPYRIDGHIASGSAANIYRAWDAAEERQVALKVLNGVVDDATRVRFRRESETLTDFRHAHVVPVYGAGEADGRLYIAMLYADGGDLRTLLRQKGRLDPARAVALLSQVALALDAGHASGLIHRDVKPGNILLRDAPAENCECVYLSDFGSTKHPDAASLTATGEIVGTCAYTAPEQFRSGAVDARTDVYALACVLYECIAGERPHPGIDYEEIRSAHLHRAVPKVSGVLGGDWRRLQKVLERGMAKDRSKRFSSCGALMAAAEKAVLQRATSSSTAIIELADDSVPVSLAALRTDVSPATPHSVNPEIGDKRSAPRTRLWRGAAFSWCSWAQNVGSRCHDLAARSRHRARPVIRGRWGIAAAAMSIGLGLVVVEAGPLRGIGSSASLPGPISALSQHGSGPRSGVAVIQVTPTAIPPTAAPSPPPSPSPSAALPSPAVPPPTVAAVLVRLPVTAPPRPAAIASVTPNSLTFPAQLVGTSAQPQIVTMTNSGNADLHVGALSVAGPAEGDFTIVSDGCSGQTVGPHATCSVAIQFAPLATGGRQASLVASDDAGPAQSVGLNGTATQPAVYVHPNPMDFGTIQSTQSGGGAPPSSSGVQVKVTNTGSADLHIRLVTIGGTNPAQFSFGGNTCSGTTIPPQGYCSLLLFFTADAPGTYQALLVLSDDGAGGGQAVKMTGTAT
jgi:serine/threonine protein kinase